MRCQDLVFSMLLVLAACSGPRSSAIADPPSRIPHPGRRPNIVFLLTDDHRADAMGCAGNAILRTPNMDRLAAEGVRFRNAFVTNSLCSPSRACYLTGQYSSRHGVRDNFTDLPDAHPTLPQMLQAAGYETAFCGKWHMGHARSDRRPGFDFWASYKGQGRYEDPAIEVNGEQKHAQGWMDDVMTGYALEFLKRPRKGPFYLQVAFKAAHGPFEPPERLRDLYRDTVFPLAPSVHEDLAGKPRYQRAGKGLDEPKEEREAALQAHMRKYHAALAGADENAGRILAYLDQASLARDTIVVFAGDNGYFHGEHRRGDKRLMYEESIRVPFLVRFPAGVKAGRVPEEMILNVDLAPTLLDYAGLPIPESMQGRSLRPFLEGRPVPWRTSFYYEYFEKRPKLPQLEGARGLRYKYCRTVGESPDEEELYDLEADPYEMANRAGDPSMKDVIESMKSEVAELKAGLGIR